MAFQVFCVFMFARHFKALLLPYGGNLAKSRPNTSIPEGLPFFCCEDFQKSFGSLAFCPFGRLQLLARPGRMGLLIIERLPLERWNHYPVTLPNMKSCKKRVTWQQLIPARHRERSCNCNRIARGLWERAASTMTLHQLISPQNVML